MKRIVAVLLIGLILLGSSMVAFSGYQSAISRQKFIYLAVRLYESLNNLIIEVNPTISFSDTDDLYALKGDAKTEDVLLIYKNMFDTFGASLGSGLTFNTIGEMENYLIKRYPTHTLNGYVVAFDSFKVIEKSDGTLAVWSDKDIYYTWKAAYLFD